MQTAEVSAPSSQRAKAGPDPLLMSVRDTATILGVSTRTIWDMISKGKLSTRKIGTRTLATAESVRHVAENGA
jgi:excisionase family DNA binding protein